MHIVILSRNTALYSTQSLYLAARKRGHEVRVIDHMRCDLMLGDEGLQIFYENELVRGVDAIIPRIGASATSYGAAVVRQFELKEIFTVVKSEALLRSRDKRTCMQYLVAGGIAVPRSFLTNNEHTLWEGLEKVGGTPVIIKLLSSTHGLGVILGESANSATSIMESFIKLREKVIMQEFIREADGTDLRVFIVDDEIVAAMERKARPGEFRSNLHRGASARRIMLQPEEREMAKHAARIMGLSVAGVDLLRSERGPLVLEVNASPGLEGIEGTTGIDIAGRIIQYIERNARQ